MNFCPICRSTMKHVYRFSPDKMMELYICSNCHFETRGKRINLDSLFLENCKPKPINKARKQKKSKKKVRGKKK